MTVAEPIALELSQSSGGYLHAQIFTGLMYIAAAICMWFLRAWKIGQLEHLATEREGPNITDPPQLEPEDNPSHGLSQYMESNTFRRMIVWKRV